MSDPESSFLNLCKALGDELQRSAEACVSTSLPPDVARSLLDRHLPDLLEMLALEILTSAEVAAAITDRYVVALARLTRQSMVETISAPWDETIARVTKLIEDSQGAFDKDRRE